MPRKACLSIAVVFAIAMSAANAEVTIENAWVRGLVAGQSTTDAFMTIRSTEATELTSISSTSAATTRIHEMAMANGMMTMEPVASSTLPAHGTIEFKPGTYHVMLIGLTKPLKIGDPCR